MKLKEARKIFVDCQKKGRAAFAIRKHCYADYPERKFSKEEVYCLLLGRGILRDNNYPSAKTDSFLWCCKDENNIEVEIAVLFDDETGILIAIAMSAFREV